MSKIKSFIHWLRSFSKNEDGAAALMGVIFAVIIIGSIAVNFLADSQQKQAGGALTYSSTNAFLAAEAGLRFAEKCLLEGGTTEAGCPCTSWTGGCDDWVTAPVNFPSDIPFGGSRGAFEIQVTPVSSTEIKVTSIGKFAGALRSFSKVVAINCSLSTNAITSCTPITNTNNSSVDPPTAPTQEGVCDIPAIPALPTFPDDPATDCPGGTGDYFNLTAGGNTYTDASVQICSWTQSSGTTTFGTSGGTTTVWVYENVNLSNSADIQILGTVKFNIKGNVSISNQVEFLVGDTTPTEGTMTMQTDGDFSMENNSKINRVMDNASDVLVLIGGQGVFKNNILFTGGIYGDQLVFDLQNNAEFKGSVVAASVSLSNNATLTFDDTAGQDSDSYEICGGGGSSSIPQEP
ncbi:MAG: hypothetical protein H8E42_14165 [Nitrospinae bacterium]|nr:hypothetical protein [Nitrospinota bacterium]MBL7021228.1 hypothetical protein [Nitrospinaceae bacterium]